MTTERVGDWMQTYTGRKFWPMDPRHDEIFIEDIAHSLAHQCRYAGHCLRFYSVAEHCVLLSECNAVPDRYRIWALLHDAAEAYLVDVPRPVKPYLNGYHRAERQIEIAVALRFNLLPHTEMPPEVKAADNRILADEKAQNMAPGLPWVTDDLEPLGVTLRYWSPGEAKMRFLDRFDELRALQAAA